MHTEPSWDDDCTPPGWREENQLRELWQAHYMTRGVARFPAWEIAKKKAAKGKRPPLQLAR
jgi:hypothetical protein